MMSCSFASDNNAGIHPLVLEAIASVNHDFTLSYGEDQITKKAEARFNEMFERECDVFFVFNGTAANVISLSGMIPSYGAIVCSEYAHIHVDECGAPERFLGNKLYTLPSTNGKLQVSDLESIMHFNESEHHSPPKVLSITQSTELGTVYSAKEISELCNFSHANGWKVHLDGARIANAVASTNESLASLTWQAGVDVMSFGGTKNGLMAAEAIVVFDKELAQSYKYLRKQGMQLASKMRFMSAQFLAYFENDLWLQNARHANDMAKLLANNVLNISQIELCYPVEANGVFAKIPASLIEPLQKESFFYVWNEANNEVRWMTSFDTKESDIKHFAERIKYYLK